MDIIRRRAIEGAERLKGFDGWLIRNPITARYRATLSRGYPATGYARIKADSSDAAGRTPGAYLGGAMEVLAYDPAFLVFRRRGLNPAWKMLLKSILSESYDECLGEAIGIQLGHARKVFRFVRYGVGGFIDAHFDNQAGKLLTQVFYANLQWKSAWGGELELLSSPGGGREAVVRSIRPLITYSIVNESTPKAYHRVSRLRQGSAVRQVLLVEWYKHG